MPNLQLLRGAKGRGSDIDRTSAEQARTLLHQLQPDPAARRVVIDLLVDAVRTAHAAAPGCWSFSLFPNVIRLNVGRLLVAEVFRDNLWIFLLDDAPGAETFRPWVTTDPAFSCLEAKHLMTLLPSSELARFAEALRIGFRPSLGAAAATARRTMYRQSWSPGVAAMLEDEAGVELPRPDWLDELPAARTWLAPVGSPTPPEAKPGDRVVLHRDGTAVGRCRVIRDNRLTAPTPIDFEVSDAASTWRLIPVGDRRLAPTESVAETSGFLPSAIDALLHDLANPAVPLDVVRSERAAFRDRFSPEHLAALHGSDLLNEMHGRTQRDSLAYWLEFKEDAAFHTRHFGSIRGGSALKFGLFHSEAGEWTVGAATTMRAIPEAEAVAVAEGQRDEILAAHEVVDRLPDDPSDPAWESLAARIAEAAPSIHQLAFLHKILALWNPDKIDDYHSPMFHGHVLARMGVPTPGPSLYDAAATFVRLLHALRAALPDLDMQQVTGALNGRFGAPHGHWRIGTSDDEVDHWPPMREGGHAAIGWPLIGNLSDLIGGLTPVEAQQRLKPLLAERYPHQTPSVTGRSASQITSFFLRAQEGDRVYAARGATILGVGEIVGPYRFDDGPFPHRRAVRWLTTTPFVAPSHTGLLTTVYNLEKAWDIQAAAARAIEVARPPEHAPLPARQARTLSLIEEQLERKGQVILYGPPGTGKTHHAVQAAQDIVAHATHGRAWATLTPTEKRTLEGREGTGQRMWTATFHPAFSYEDFVEGLRPVATGGQLSFEPRPGLFRRICSAAATRPDERFVLIIDEFNRGDAPRIFGELLTVLELDKRERVPVTLPTSGDSFTVPRNVYLIATMNTADRSIALLDAALRRRFGFIEYLPDASVLQDSTAAGIGLGALLGVLNERLLRVLGDAGRNRQIGHAYLLGQLNVHTLRSAFQYDILPLLQDYCSDDGEMLESLLGKELYDKELRRFRPSLFQIGQEDAFVAALSGLGAVIRDEVGDDA